METALCDFLRYRGTSDAGHRFITGRDGGQDIAPLGVCFRRDGESGGDDHRPRMAARRLVGVVELVAVGRGTIGKRRRGGICEVAGADQAGGAAGALFLRPGAHLTAPGLR